MTLMAEVEYDLAYMFAYSERERTLAHRKYDDDVPEDVKKRRLSEIISQQMKIQEKRNKNEIGNVHIVLAEGNSKKSDEQLSGRSDTNKMVVFDKDHYQKGDYVAVEIMECTSATLIGKPLYKTTTQEFFSKEAVSA
jgi:tRNA-2-methylthio-N6-dimethylallyladenosine synthase